MGKEKKLNQCKLKIIDKIHRMWYEMEVVPECTTRKMLELTFSELWEKQMEVSYKLFKFKEDANQNNHY